MSIVYLLINCDEKFTESLKTEISLLTSVKDVHVVSGPYNMIVKLESSSDDVLKEQITWKIRKIDKIRSTMNLMVRKDFEYC
ncbi:MAG: Lrp/AsnC family transcriptional regulator [Thaumarchaeota archaeon]|nr:Lrp/AsnC family transcriptional regulator [Nitrososphaerota archaeon]